MADTLVCAEHGTRRTQRSPCTHQRSRRCSTQQPGIHHARSSELVVRYSGNADHSYRSSPTASRRTAQPRSRQQRDHLRFVQCGTDPEVYTGTSDHHLMLHMVQKHGGQQVIQESVAQLRQLDRAASVLCDTIRSRQCTRRSHRKKDTPTRDITKGDV